MKEYTRIEKTAIFVSTQGPQMEILIKAKQSDNPQFSFLNQNDCLYKFYRHVLDAVKNRRYKAQVFKPGKKTILLHEKKLELFQTVIISDKRTSPSRKLICFGSNIKIL